MAKQIISKKFDVDSAEQFVYTVRNDGGYYVFAAKHTQFENGDLTIPEPTDSVSNNMLSIYDDMLYGKSISSTDVEHLIPRYDWQSGTKYAMYDDQTNDLFTSQFYTVVNNGGNYNVYKCLFNANTASTVEPFGTDTDQFELSDGYIWKYMYTASSAQMTKFATTSYLPCVANASVTAAAIDGSIEVIKVEDAGAGYDNYITGSFALAADLAVGGSQFDYRLVSTASSVDDFYNGCLLLITSGPAINEYREIVDYNGSTKVATLNAPFTSPTPAVGNSYEIYPLVDVFDTGGLKQTNCIARAIVNPAAANSISNIEVINLGSGYRSAIADIIISPAVGVSAEANLRPIFSPAGGHGANVLDELGANYAGVSISFTENDGDVDPQGDGLIRCENDFRQVGVLKNPRFANVKISFSSGNTVGNFVGSEQLYKYRDIQLTGTVNVSSLSTTVTGNDTKFEDALSVGDQIIITDGTSNFFGSVATIASNTSMTISANAGFTSDLISIAVVNTAAFGVVSATSTGVIYTANVPASSTLATSKFIGEDSFATTIADTIEVSRAGSSPDLRSNTFSSFSQLTKLEGSISAGTFTEDEFVTQPSAVTQSQPSARVYAAVEGGGTDYMYLTNVKNIWNITGGNQVATGNTSEAQFTVSAKYDGELIPDSGEVIYIENISPVSRANTQTETIKLILEF